MSPNNLRIVLVRPQYSGNIGAVARAMRNMGLSDLALVNPTPLQRAQADMMAVHARDVLEAMQVYPSLRAAVGECGLVVGTTCRTGLYRDSVVSPRELAPHIAEASRVNRVAMVFGPEESGLANDDLRLCHRLITIPTDSGYLSLNVSQAVLVCCYEVFLASREEPPVIDRPLAEVAQQELMYEKFKQALLRIGFLHKENPEHIMFALRRIFGRAALEERDVRILLGMARQISWYATDGWRYEHNTEKRENHET